MPTSSPDRNDAGRGRLPPSLIYAGFAGLALLATYPAWRVAVFGLTIEDWLLVRCF